MTKTEQNNDIYKSYKNLGCSCGCGQHCGISCQTDDCDCTECTCIDCRTKPSIFNYRQKKK